MYVVFTGGGTAGHVTPNIALIAEAQKRGWQTAYIGSPDGIECDMITALGIPFHGIASGKLRRYFSWQNFIDPFRILFGCLQSLLVLMRNRPDVVFSKGGFVSVPVVAAAWCLRIPVISHESDISPGLANRLAYPFCRRICVTFEETLAYLPRDKVRLTGTPVRESLLHGQAAAGLEYLGFSGDKPVLLVFGGSLGASAINQQVRSILPALLTEYDLVHVVGEAQLETGLSQPGYVQKSFVGAEFGDVLAAASLVVSRAGANSLYELFLLRKPHLLIPLTRAASRGDQLENAAVFSAKGYSLVLTEDTLTDAGFLQCLKQLQNESEDFRTRLESFERLDSVALIFNQLNEVV